MNGERISRNTRMVCLNKLLISFPPFPPTQTPNSQTKSSYFLRRISIHKFSLIHKAYHRENETESKNTLPLAPNVNFITSTSNPFVKHCVKLRENSSYRHSHGSILIVGITPISEICSSHKTLPDRTVIECLLVLENYDIPGKLDVHDVRVVRVSSLVINKISGVQSTDSVDVIALVRIPPTFKIVSNSPHEEDCNSWFSSPRRILVLDGIQDPGNLGTLIRSAAAFKWGGVFLLSGCCDPFNDKALRACRGACFQIPIISGNWKQVQNLREKFKMRMLAGHPSTDNPNAVIELSKEFADSIAELPICLVLGSEGTGLSEISRKACELVSIPMQGEFESLNVSVAGAIFMYMLQT